MIKKRASAPRRAAADHTEAQPSHGRCEAPCFFCMDQEGHPHVRRCFRGGGDPAGAWRWRQGRVPSQQPQISGCSVATTVWMTALGRGERLAARRPPQRPEPLPAGPVSRVIDCHRCAEGRSGGWGGAIRMSEATMAVTPPHRPEIEGLDCHLCLDGRFAGWGQVSPRGAATARPLPPSVAPVSMLVEAHGRTTRRRRPI